MWLPLTQVHLSEDNVMVCRGWGHVVPANPCYLQEEGKCMAGMLSTHCHQQPPQQTSSSHSLLRSLNLASTFIWAATIHISAMADAMKPLHHALATQQSTPHLPFSSLWPQSVSILVSHSNPEVSHDRIQLHYSFLSDSISKAQLKMLTFPITYSNHPPEM